MDSAKQSNMYTDFEPEANEIMFGQRTLPNRPLTDKELSRRKRLMLKLLDQKLKFDLIELMARQQKEMNIESPIPTVNRMNDADSNIVASSSACPTNYQQSSENLQQNRQQHHGNGWQPPQPYEMNTNVSRYQANSLQLNVQSLHYNQNRIMTPSFRRIQPSNNLVCSPIVSSGNNQQKIIAAPNSTVSKPTNISTKISLDNEKVASFIPKSSNEAAASVSINKFTSTSLQKSRHDSAFQFDHSTTPKQRKVDAPSKQSLQSEAEPFQQSKIQSESTKHNRQFHKDDPLDAKEDCLRNGTSSICEKRTILPSSSNSQEVNQSTNLLEPSSTPLLESNDSSQRRRRRSRKRKRPNSQEDFQSKRLLIQQTTQAIEGISDAITDEAAVKPNIMAGTEDVKMPSNNIEVANNTSNKQGSQIISRKWNRLTQLVTIMCRDELNHCEPNSPSELNQKNEIIIQMSINPNAIRSNSTVVQKVPKEKLDKFINECKIILDTVWQGGQTNRSNFAKMRNELIVELQSSNSQLHTSNETLKVVSLQKKIEAIISPFLCPEEKCHELIAKLIKSPFELEDNAMIKNRIISKNLSVSGLMRQIKEVLDSQISARSPKKFHVALAHYVDVPFVVSLCNKSGIMTKENASKLQATLLDFISDIKTPPKPKLRDIKFSDGSLLIVCTNRMSFDWLGKTIPDHIGVNILPVKNVISKSALKTICLKFEVPQYFHFNNLMEQLKVDNPLLLTRRWELRSFQHQNVDATKCIYVGVDVDSLIVLEQMDRVGYLRGSSVSFDISYDENEENFEPMNYVVKKSRRRLRKIKSVII